MENTFKELRIEESVFKDKQSLDHKFLPNHLPHRKEQMKSIAKYSPDFLTSYHYNRVIMHQKIHVHHL